MTRTNAITNSGAITREAPEMSDPLERIHIVRTTRGAEVVVQRLVVHR